MQPGRSSQLAESSAGEFTSQRTLRNRRSELQSTLLSKTAKTRKDNIRSRVLPEALREKKFVLWQKQEHKNGFYGAEAKAPFSRKSKR